MPSTATTAVAVICCTVVAPVLLIVTLLGTIGVVTEATASGNAGAVDPAKIPPLARELLPEITTITATRCPELPPLWVIAEVQAESGWNPAAFSTDRNGGAAGLYQLNQQNWTSAGGRPWPAVPPPAGADILDPVRHLELAIPFVCANLRSVATQLAATGKPTSALDAMLVCHIAGCGRVTGSATGVPIAGEAGCDETCAGLVGRYIATVHRYLTAYATAGGPVDISDLAVPTPFTGRDTGCSEPDPTTRGCLTPTTLHALEATIAVFGPPGRTSPIHSVTCWDPHPQNPRSDHPKGRACDFFPTTAGTFPAGTDLENGWRIASWLRANAVALKVKYLIWQGRYWDPTTSDQDGWGVPYDGGGIYDPHDATGGHYDHIHSSFQA
ncbi:MAG: transglycosylase SLT domain-containing protein [Pseudonocardia sp.]|uniref:transglycosylase SLT domain-containing protein n=1 Tax=Pseudonocardia sp. TaxID=60912 RepID=UPI001AD2A5A2|nr:transglycosylase SLT domain-containing protein [Pseudonocardia sp.]MBN9098143.1 transglycosylase SLT domain-containing protein [Pseudonocardia sp.]